MRQLSKPVDDRLADLDALERVDAVRKALAADPAFKDALTPGAPVPPFEQPGVPGFAFQLIGSFAKTYLWPVGLVLLAVAAIAGVIAAFAKVGGFWAVLWAGVVGFACALWTGFWIALLILVIVAGIGYWRLRVAEDNDSLEERAPPTRDPRRDVRAREPARLRAEPHDLDHASASRARSAGSPRAWCSGPSANSRRISTARAS